MQLTHVMTAPDNVDVDLRVIKVILNHNATSTGVGHSS